MRLIVVVTLAFIYNGSFAQKQDHIWLFGQSLEDNVLEEYREDTTFGATTIDFNFEPPKVYYDKNRLWDFNGSNASLSSPEGELLIYSNGQAIYDGTHEVIEDTINYSQHWDNWNFIYNNIVINSGLPTLQGCLLLPMPNNQDSIFLFYMQLNADILKYDKLMCTMLHVKNDSINLAVRDSILSNEEMSAGGLNAVRHANGRDWWILKAGKGTASFYKYLLSANGLEYYGKQEIGIDVRSGFDQMYFSPIGDKLAYMHHISNMDYGAYLGIMDFDRTTGDLSNLVQEHFINYTFSLGLGVSFSPNGKLLYATDSDHMFQYDMESNNIIDSKEIVAEYDMFEYYSPQDTFQVQGWPTTFSLMGLGPNGKIYGSSGANNTRVMHVINNPNIRGEGCDVAQHSIQMPTKYSRTMPNFPNFRLGPLDDSPADTLGLNNHPIAKYRYVQDTLEDLHVHFFDLSYYDPEDYFWNFGDGNTSDELEPNHTYAEKGVYEVCLTVSNIYDTNTSCKTIMLGTTSTTDKELEVDVSIYPNPTSDYLTINFHNYLALDGMVRFYDVSGREVKSVKLNRASTVLDLQDLPTGAYVYKVYDGVEELYTGQVVVVK